MSRALSASRCCRSDLFRWWKASRAKGNPAAFGWSRSNEKVILVGHADRRGLEMSTILLTDHVETPIGPMILMVEDDALIGLEFDDQPERYMKDIRRRYPDHVMREKVNPCGFSDHVRAYYAGDLAAVDDLPVKGGGTPFQERVWAELRRIKIGT